MYLYKSNGPLHLYDDTMGPNPLWNSIRLIKISQKISKLPVSNKTSVDIFVMSLGLEIQLLLYKEFDPIMDIVHFSI
jgi:hypothetical protein